MVVRFENVTLHDTIMEPRRLGTYFSDGNNVDDAWFNLCESLAERENADPRDFSYDDWRAV